MKTNFLRFVAVLLLTISGVAISAQAAAPASAEALRASAEAALTAKDTNAFTTLFNHQGVANLTNGFEERVFVKLNRFFHDFPTNTLRTAVRLEPMPEDMETENTINGVRFRPNLTPLGIMSCRITTRSDGTNVSWGVTMPYGEMGGQFGFIGTITEKVYVPKHKENIYSVAVTAGMAFAPVGYAGTCVYVQNGTTITNSFHGHRQTHKIYSGDELKACTVQADVSDLTNSAPVTLQVYQAAYDGAAYTNILVFSGHTTATNSTISFIPTP
jgi:hypothetical protein